jgi:hypothetical protein
LNLFLKQLPRIGIIFVERTEGYKRVINAVIYLLPCSKVRDQNWTWDTKFQGSTCLDFKVHQNQTRQNRPRAEVGKLTWEGTKFLTIA